MNKTIKISEARKKQLDRLKILDNETYDHILSRVLAEFKGGKR